MDTASLAPIIRYHRKRAHLNQSQLAQLAGVGKTAVFDLEKGQGGTRLSTLLKVLNVLNIRLTWESPLKADYLKQGAGDGDHAAR